MLLCGKSESWLPSPVIREIQCDSGCAPPSVGVVALGAGTRSLSARAGAPRGCGKRSAAARRGSRVADAASASNGSHAWRDQCRCEPPTSSHFASASPVARILRCSVIMFKQATGLNKYCALTKNVKALCIGTRIRPPILPIRLPLSCGSFDSLHAVRRCRRGDCFCV